MSLTQIWKVLILSGIWIWCSKSLDVFSLLFIPAQILQMLLLSGRLQINVTETAVPHTFMKFMSIKVLATFRFEITLSRTAQQPKLYQPYENNAYCLHLENMAKTLTTYVCSPSQLEKPKSVFIPSFVTKSSFHAAISDSISAGIHSALGRVLMLSEQRHLSKMWLFLW